MQFDYDSFVSTATDLSKVAENFDWKPIPNKHEALGQITKIDYSFISADYPDSFKGRHVVSMKITWRLQDDQLAAEMNMQEVNVQQDVLMELTAPPPPHGNGTIKWGQNENQSLKDLIKGVKLDGEKKFVPSMLMNQVGWLVTKNSDPNEDGRSFTKVVLVKDPSAGRRSWEARQAGTAKAA